jgi:hypothetical protein
MHTAWSIHLFVTHGMYLRLSCCRGSRPAQAYALHAEAQLLDQAGPAESWQPGIVSSHTVNNNHSCS